MNVATWLMGKVRDAWTIEREFKLGKVNQQWAMVVFIIWVALLILGFQISYIPISEASWNPLHGFSFENTADVPTWLTVIAVLALPLCMTGLYIAKNKGWVDRDDI